MSASGPVPASACCMEPSPLPCYPRPRAPVSPSCPDHRRGHPSIETGSFAGGYQARPDQPQEIATVEGMLALMIPIAAIVLGIGAGMLAIWVDYRKKREFFQLHHAERMAAIEKGIEVPPLPPEFFANYRKQRTPEDALRHGLLWLFVGIAVTVALFS